MGVSMKADYLERANATKQLVEAEEGSDGHPRHYTHSDGVCRDGADDTKVGTFVFLAPGRSERQYETVARDSPAR